MVLRRGDRGDRDEPPRRPVLRRARPEDPALVTAELILSQEPIDGPPVTPGSGPVLRSNWQIFRRRFFRHKMALVSIAILVILIIACFGAPLLAPYKQGEQNLLL